MTLMTFRQYLVEMKNGKYSYSSTQVNLPPALAKEIIQWGENGIRDRDVFTDPDDPSFGREDEIHATVLYGLHDSSPDKLRRVLKDQKPFKCRLREIKKFSSKDSFDVIYISVESTPLKKLNKLLTDKMAATISFPDYTPHVTIAYVQKGKADKLLGSEDFFGREFEVNEIIFSSRNGEKTPIKLEAK